MKNHEAKRRAFNTALLPAVLALAWPTMLEQLMQTAVQYIDTAMVGTLGTAATAAVGSTTTLNWLINSTISAFGIGVLSYISQARGAGDHTRARGAAAQSVLAVLVLGSFFTVLTVCLSGRVPVWMQVDPSIRGTASRYFMILYLPTLARTAMLIFGVVLRSAGDARTPMRAGIAVNIINVVLNFLLIYEPREIYAAGLRIPMWGAGLGVTGAAAASAVSILAGGALLTRALWRHGEISPRGFSIRPDRRVLVPCLKVALPNMFQRFGSSLGYVAFAAMINSLGEISTAAHTVANTVESAFYIPGYGMMSASATLSGNAIGASDRRRLRELTVVITVTEVVLMVISGSLLFAFAPSMAGIFSKDAAVISLAAAVLRMVACSEPIYGVSIVIEGMLQGAGKTVVPFIFNMAGMWGVRIVGTFICTQVYHLGLVSAWACMIGHNLLLFILYTAYFSSGRWNPLGRSRPSGAVPRDGE